MFKLRNLGPSALLAAAAFVSLSANASVSVKNGLLTINVDGADSQDWGGNGDDAGDVSISLSYTDATKTQVLVKGTATQYRSLTYCLLTLIERLLELTA